jgi:DNA-directed RNA polymerase specialized sigma24 family protein
MTVSAKNSPRERDSALLIAVAAGDRRALEELYLGYHRRLSRFLARFTPRYENIEEIINDTFMVVWQSAKDLDHRDCLSNGFEVAAASEESHRSAQLG